jgi:hypothetical protein
MNQKTTAHTTRIYFQNLFILTFFFHLLGCMGHLSTQQYPKSDEHQLMLAEANDAFQNKAFFKAEELFRKLNGEAYNHDIRRISLYGLACTRFVLAENDRELNQAFDLWYSWYKIPSENIPAEDPRMMEPVFEKIISRPWTFDTFSEKTLQDEASDTYLNSEYSHPPAKDVENSSSKEFGYEKPVMNKKQMPISSIETSGPVSDIQYLLESREKEILKLRQQLGSMEKNIKLLKNQIHAIEEIHQEIFEKKKGMRLR